MDTNDIRLKRALTKAFEAFMSDYFQEGKQERIQFPEAEPETDDFFLLTDILELTDEPAEKKPRNKQRKKSSTPEYRPRLDTQRLDNIAGHFGCKTGKMNAVLRELNIPVVKIGGRRRISREYIPMLNKYIETKYNNQL